MLHFGPGDGYACGNKTIQNGIIVNTYSADWSIPEYKAELHIDYYWTGGKLYYCINLTVKEQF